MNWLVLIVLIIIIGNALIGIRAGFIKTIFSLFSLIIALVLTSLVSPQVSNFLKGNEKFYNSVMEKVEEVIPLQQNRLEGEEQRYIDSLPIPKNLKDNLIRDNNESSYRSFGIHTLEEYVHTYITNIVINAISFLITFFVILIGLWILSFVLNLISKLPVLNQINKMAGLVAGLVHGLVIVWVLFLVLTVFGGTTFGQQAFQMMEESMLLSLIYNNNLLLEFVANATRLFLKN